MSTLNRGLVESIPRILQPITLVVKTREVSPQGPVERTLKQGLDMKMLSKMMG